MMNVTCFFCKKNNAINRSDDQYFKIKKNPKASYVCKDCSTSMQKEAQKSTGLNPDTIDLHNKYL
ncbi:DUF2197 domain-containing protein [Halobacillus mangrovi]|uniref:DUF2197 domain-containing protein n=1 Tax=Halobacillus mangrovi TaxID=402384 RepID=UPI003D95EE9F